MTALLSSSAMGKEREGWGCMRWARGVRESTALAPTSCPGQLCTHASLVAKSCLTLGDPMDCSLPGFSVHGISQARILEWIAISFSQGFPQTRDSTSISYIGRQVLYHSNTCCCCYSVTQSCLTLCHLMGCSMPGVPAHHHLPEPIQTRVH